MRGMVENRAYRRDQGGSGSLKTRVSAPFAQLSTRPPGHPDRTTPLTKTQSAENPYKSQVDCVVRHSRRLLAKGVTCTPHDGIEMASWRAASADCVASTPPVPVTKSAPLPETHCCHVDAWRVWSLTECQLQKQISFARRLTRVSYSSTRITGRRPTTIRSLLPHARCHLQNLRAATMCVLTVTAVG